jgi:tyrosine-protein kinase Etk/Wzc
MDAPHSPPDASTVEGRDWPFGEMIRRRWALVAVCFLVGCLAATIYSLFLPKEYDATAALLPAQDGGASRAMLGNLAAQPGAGALVGGFLPAMTSTKDIFLGILKSRTMQDDAIKKFDLVKVYELERSKAPLRDARNMLQTMTNIRASREGVISVTVSAYDAKMAADMANFYVENLDRLNTTINVTEAGRTRLFLEERTAEAQKALRDSEDRLRAYQTQTKAVVMEGQTKAAIEGMARLEGQILAAEVQLKTVETFSTARNPDVIKLKESVDEMRRQLKRMEYGRDAVSKGKGKTADGGDAGADAGNRGADFSVSLGSIPATGAQLGRLIREAKIQETIFTLLTQQLEQAKIAEAKDTPTVRILDRAVPPEWKSRPSLRNNVMIGGVLSLLLGVCLAFVLETRRRPGTQVR